jgi:predicted Zn-dependent protease
MPRHLLRNARRVLLLGLVGLWTAGQAGCAPNPVTGGLQLALITEGQEIEMGRQGAEQVVRSIGLVDDPALQAYMQELGARLAQVSERPELPWTFGVVDDPTPNAFALPGGFVYFTRGMMNLMSSEAQLAAVLGHEIGHVTARHHVTRLSRAQLAQIGLGVGGVLFPTLQQLGGLAGAGLELVFLSHGRDAERQADDLGFRYALSQGYDVREMAVVFAALERLGEAAQRSAIPSWLMTHPAPGERIQAVEQRIAALETPPAQLRVAEAPYLARIDGLIHGVNPRNGIFRDGVFLHPDLRFRFSFPTGWNTQNLAQMVMGVSPQQNAAIQLTLAQDNDPLVAAQRFARQQGLQAGQASRQTINGLPAVILPFQAQTQQTVLQGLVGFIAHEGRVYQIVTYSPAGIYAQYQRAFQQTIGSFAPLSDPAILGLQPNRLSIVRLPAAMTLAEFNTRYPSAVPIAELAILNQVAGPESLLPSGAMVKRVVAGQAGS